MADASLCIAQGQAEDIEPAVGAVSAAVAALDVIGTAGFVCLQLGGSGALKVIRMHDVGAFPTFQFFEGPAEIFERWLIECLDFTSPRGDRNRNWNAVNDQIKI